MGTSGYRQNVYAAVLEFCSVEGDPDKKAELAAGLSSMSLHDLGLLNYMITTVAEDDFSHLALDDSMRVFLSDSIIRFIKGETEHFSDEFYGAVWESMVSVSHTREQYGFSTTPESTRSCLDLTLGLFLANDFEAPADEQFMALIHGTTNRSYQRVRELALLEMVDAHPEWCSKVIEFIVNDGIRHASAVEAAIVGSAKHSLVSGVL